MIIQEIPFDVVDWASITEETIQGTKGTAHVKTFN